MRRAVFAAAGCALLAAPVSAAPVDGKVQQAVADTLSRSLQNRGYSTSDPVVEGTLNSVQQSIVNLASAGASECGASCSPPTFKQVIDKLNAYLPLPLQIGKKGEPFQGLGGDFGGGGATGQWEAGCGDVRFDVDAQGNLIIPSKPLKPGANISFQMNYWHISPPKWTQHISSSEKEGAVLRFAHLRNMTRQVRDWYGVIGVNASNGCIRTATVAYRNAAGNVVGRNEDSVCPVALGPWTQTVSDYEKNNYGVSEHRQCPDGDASGGGFHFYGSSSHTAHPDVCHWYAPNAQLGFQGYAINPRTTIPGSEAKRWPVNIPEHLKLCSLDEEMLRRLADAAYRDAAAQPGYNGAPYQPVKPGEGRPGDAKVDDLADDPTTGVSNPPPDPQAPPPTTTNPPPAGSSDECDFKGAPTGCTDPGTAAPSLDDPPTNIMEPIFDWLPDIPSLDFSAGTACPVWTIDATAFGGLDWLWVMQSHCEIIEQNLTIISALMISIFGIGAAMIILRA